MFIIDWNVASEEAPNSLFTENTNSGGNIMLGRVFFAKSDEIFTDLFNLANEELGSKGLNIEPSIIVSRIISPLKENYLKNLTELLESCLEKNS